MFLPGTYGTSLIKNHALNGVINKMVNDGIPSQAIEGFKDAVDANIYFFNNQVEPIISYLVMIGTVAILMTAYVLITVFSKKKSK